MIEKRLDKIEAHMEQLIKMVDENNKVVNSLSERMDSMEQKFDREHKLNEERHKELLKETRNNTVEIDYLRNEVSKHDMTIHKLETSNRN